VPNRCFYFLLLRVVFQSSRSAPKPAPTFLHLDDGCTVVLAESGDHVLTHVNGDPLDPDRVYSCAVCVQPRTTTPLNPMLFWGQGTKTL
jgi:hypothetical protein